jgi:hypothetical protein
MSLQIVSDGLDRADTRIAFEKAKLALAEGRILESAHKFVRAVGVMVDSGLRSQIARPYAQQSAELAQQGALSPAAEACAIADRILEGYDDGDSMSMRCSLIRLKLRYAHPAPASTSAP